MGLKFLQDIVNLDNIQFVNSSGTNAGLINMDGNDLVLSNPLGDILLGDGASDVYIGDGANNVDILFEQSGSIKADDSASGVVLTLGSSNTTLAFGGNTSFAGIVTAISGTSANTVDVGTNGVPFKNIYAAHHVGGSSINYATSRGWVEDDAPLSSTQGGFYGGDFVRNGDADENAVVRGQDPFNNKALLWKCILHDTDDDADGGWNKNITIPANNNIGYLSYVYFMADFTPDSSTAGTRDGTVYLGCGTASGQTINISNNSSNTNPYFISHPLYTINNGGPVIAERWYLMIGVIQPYNDETTGNDTISGVYDVETGERVATGSEFKMGNNTTSQIHRAYVYYDESGDAGENVYFWNPGFHAIDGSEPKLQDLLKRQIYVLDNVKAAFGDSDDLQIYHDGSDSIIKDSGTGSLDIYSSHIHLKSAGGTNDLAQFFSGGHSYIYANNVLRIEATTSGVNITGDMAVSGTVDGIDIAARDAVLTSTTTTANAALPKTGGTMTGNLTINSTYPRIFLTDSDNNDDWSIINNDGKFGIYNDTDTSYALSIDGSNNVGIGTSSPSKELHIKSSAPRVLIEGTGASAEDAEISRISGLWDGTYVADIQFLAGDDTSNKDNGKIAFRTYTSDGAVGTRMLIEEAGNVGIGTTSPSAKLEVAGDLTVSGTAPTLRIQDSRNLNNPDWDSVSLGNIEFYTSDTTSPGARVLAEIEAFSNNAAASGPNADLIFKTSTITDSSPQTRLTIGHDGTATFTGNIVVSGTVDSRDVATDGTKLDTIDTNADVTPSWVPSSDPSYLTAHPNISAASSVNNSGKTHIQDITVDSNGHVTGIVSHALSSSDFVEPNSNATLNSLSCGTFTHPTDIAFVLDNDNNENASFSIKDGAGNTPFILTEAGDLTITGKFVSTYAAKGSSGDILVEDSGEIKKRTPTELKADLSLNNVPNTDATNASNLGSGTVPTARLATTTIAKGGTGAVTASGARTALGVDAAGTDNSTDVTLAGSLNYITISGQEITRNAIDLAADVTGTLPQTNLPDDMDSDKVKQICTTHHNFFMNSSSTSADFFVPFNNLNESSNPTNVQYYNRMVAPYNGRIVKVVLHTTAAIGTSCQVLFWVATSAGVFAPSAAETVTGVNLNAANTSATATFSTNSTAQFSAEDVLGVSIIKSSSSTANMQVTVVWEYTL